jgi:putative aldouronate transport system permease protein
VTHEIETVKKRGTHSWLETGGRSGLAASFHLTMKRVRRDKYLLILFLVPFLYYLIFQYGPMYGVLIGFKHFRFALGIRGSEWAGFYYFRQFFQDRYAFRLIRNVLVLNFYQLLFAFPAPIILALLLNEVRNDRFKRVIQTITYLPYFVSTVVVAGLIVNFLSHQGPINNMLNSIGLERISFLSRSEWYRFIHVGSDIWQNVGFGSIIFLAALTAIDPQLYEAATVDGASRWRKMLSITLPGITPTITIMMILKIGNFLTIGFQKILLLYNPATYETADVIQTYVYRRGLLSAEFSYATAVGLFQSCAALVFILAANYAAKRIGETSLW